MERYDLVVLGSGAGGGTPAMRCVKAGWRVLLVDDQPPGGTCALRGCDPKKVLVGAAELVDSQRRMSAHGIAGDARIDWSRLMEFKRTFTDPVPGARQKAYADAGIEFIADAARFTSPGTLVVNGREVNAERIVIATGASPAPLNIVGEELVKTSTDFLEQPVLPPRVIFIGAGYISMEFAHVVQRAGSQAIVLGRGKPLTQFDEALVERLVEHTREIGVDLRLDAEVSAVTKTESGVRVQFNTPEGPRTADGDVVFHGAGRRPNTHALNVEAGTVDVDERGAVVVNEFLQSVSNARVYAAGDVVLPRGSAPLTPVGGHEASVVAHNLLNGNSRSPDYRAIPSVVFTLPALAGVGMTENAARREGIPIEVKSGDTRGWYSARRVAEPAAMFKTIVNSETGRIVGAHLLGPHLEDVINLFALAIRNQLPASALKEMLYAYPTSSSDVPHML